MSKDFFHSDFAKHSKFRWDFILNIRDLDRWQLLSNNYQRYFQKIPEKISFKEKIPKKIHQVWIGPKKIPEKYLHWGKTWIKKNPQWEYKLWTDKDIKNLSMHNKSLFYSTNNVGFKSDLARYEILYKYGGIYIDTDFECLEEIPDNLRNFDFVSSTGFDFTPVILNGFIMASPKNYIIKKIIYDIESPYNSKEPMDVINSSGPNRLTSLYFRHYCKNSIILPSNYCYPYPSFLINSKEAKKDEITSLSFAIHHWEMSWMKGKLISRVFLKIKYLLNNFFKQ